MLVFALSVGWRGAAALAAAAAPGTERSLVRCVRVYDRAEEVEMRVDLDREPGIDKSIDLSLRLRRKMGGVLRFLPRNRNYEQDVP
jgi:hypothetical protein